ncbi:hypothetical protein [Gordonia sp. 852002-50395_SCH5434458]|uniref:hypothetical protein n=1 Tax=Gordonia sp. 852002-50395_SCH5434458 TaxID=1834090 RepID=UPI0012E87A6D|nr:hypothetical protein [Gordonia sp. 852002-50395_SCH5434458]
MRAEGDRLDREAALLEGFARDRYDCAAREHGFGTLMFMRSIDTADAQRAEAARLRDLARQYRRAARSHLRDRGILTGVCA